MTERFTAPFEKEKSEKNNMLIFSNVSFMRQLNSVVSYTITQSLDASKLNRLPKIILFFNLLILHAINVLQFLIYTTFHFQLS